MRESRNQMDKFAKTDPRPSYSTKERDAIRRGLKAYIKAYNVGAPALHASIGLFASESGWQEMSQSTVQNFVGAKVRTIDSTVHMIAMFLDKAGIEPVPESAADGLGEMVAAFIAPEDGAPRSPIWDTLPGEYNPILGAPTTITMSIDEPGEAHFAAVEELHEFDTPEAAQHYEGVAAAQGSLIFVMLRHSVNRQLRSYWLARQESKEGEHRRYLLGSLTEPLFRRELPGDQANMPHKTGIMSQNGVILQIRKEG